jgi:hypothetical protein
MSLGDDGITWHALLEGWRYARGDLIKSAQRQAPASLQEPPTPSF